WSRNRWQCFGDDGRRESRTEVAVAIEQVELGGQLGAGLVSGAWVWLQAARDQPIERLGNRCLDASCRRWRALHALHQVSKGALADCGQPSAYEHVVQDQAERIYVGALIDRFAQSLLR